MKTYFKGRKLARSDDNAVLFHHDGELFTKGSPVATTTVFFVPVSFIDHVAVIIYLWVFADICEIQTMSAGSSDEYGEPEKKHTKRGFAKIDVVDVILSSDAKRGGTTFEQLTEATISKVVQGKFE